MSTRTITVAGAGITGLWQALTLARRGHRVRLVERASDPFALSASAYAGAMLAPYCETEAAAPVILDLGLESIGLWRENFPAPSRKARWWLPPRGMPARSSASRG